ncbi:MAG: ribosomal protein [Candidatus Saccharibacteria bacterium]|nr:ribosomal protein [Candidatus Saccharibacteria bacterium]
MKYNELKTRRAKDNKRVGRGISAGRGKTAGRGTKGQGSRKSSLKQGFAGGQTPLYMQLPKLRGFKSKKAVIEAVYTGQLDAVKKAVIDNFALADAGLISSPYVKAKLISKGELKGKKTVKIQAASAGAIELVEKLGGAVELVEQVARPAQKIDKK